MNPKHLLRIAVTLVAACCVCVPVTHRAGAQVPDQDLIAIVNSHQIDLVIPTTNGRLVWKEVATSLAESLKLDGPTVSKIFPTGSLDLNSSASVLILLGVDVALGDAVSVAMIRDSDGDPALRLRCDRNAIRLLSSKHHAVPAQIHVDADWKRRTSNQPLVICLHGLKSDYRRFDDFRQFMRASGYATAAVTYDDHQSVVTSAQQLSDATKRLFDQWHRPHLVLVGHSMGGLVAREWAENPELENQNVVALITAGTPHRGSNWATLPPLLDLFADRRFSVSDIIDVILHQPSSPGMRDLAPDSDFLAKLHSRPRRPNVQYTTIVGTRSPVTAENVAQLRTTLQRLNEKSATIRLLGPRIRPLLHSFDELADGTGDGIVAIDRATMEGVDDVVAVEVTHPEFFRRPRGNRSQPVWETILERANKVAATTRLPE